MSRLVVDSRTPALDLRKGLVQVAAVVDLLQCSHDVRERDVSAAQHVDEVGVTNILGLVLATPRRVTP